MRVEVDLRALRQSHRDFFVSSGVIGGGGSVRGGSWRLCAKGAWLVLDEDGAVGAGGDEPYGGVLRVHAGVRDRPLGQVVLAVRHSLVFGWRLPLQRIECEMTASRVGERGLVAASRNAETSGRGGKQGHQEEVASRCSERDLFQHLPLQHVPADHQAR